MPGPDYTNRIAGAVLGAAIGDAMGHPTEFLSLDEIVSKYGPAGVTGFELWWEQDGAKFAPYTDDTQMAEIVQDRLPRQLPGKAVDAIHPHGRPPLGAGLAQVDGATAVPG